MCNCRTETHRPIPVAVADFNRSNKAWHMDGHFTQCVVLRWTFELCNNGLFPVILLCNLLGLEKSIPGLHSSSGLLDKNLKDDRILSYHSRITQAVSRVDFPCEFQPDLLDLSGDPVEFVLPDVHSGAQLDELLYEVVLNSWSTVVFFMTVMSAAFVGESADMVKQYVAENN